MSSVAATYFLIAFLIALISGWACVYYRRKAHLAVDWPIITSVVVVIGLCWPIGVTYYVGRQIKRFT